jgi:hypothetical protein
MRLFKCPINYYHNNLVFNADKSCWAIFKIQGDNYEFLSEAGKRELNWRLANYLGGITSDAQLHIIPVEQDIDAHYDSIVNNLDKADPLYPRSEPLFQKQRNYLKSSIQSKAEVNDYTNYIYVKLQMSANQLDVMKEAFSYFVKDPINAVHSWLNLDTRDILESKIEEYQHLANGWLEQQSELLCMTRATAKETQWLIKRAAYRGMPENKINLLYDDTDKKNIWQPKAELEDGVLHPQKSIVNLFEGKITPKNRYLEVETEEGLSYQSFMVMSHFPDEIRNPGREWIYKLLQKDVKPEICIHFEAIDPERSLKKVEGKQQEIESQTEHVREAGARVPKDLKEGLMDGMQLENELRNNREPLLVSTIQFCVASQDKDDMQSRSKKLINFFKMWQFAVERPVADQSKLFFNFIPSVTNMVKGYAMPLTPLAAASGIFSTTHNVGDSKGPYIGTFGMKKVFLDLAQACLENMSAAASFFGNLGVGKSYNANLLTILAVLNGASGLIIDPKGERSHWVEKFELLKGHINLINIGTEKENRGVLDPYNIYPDDLETATELLINIVIELCKIEYGSETYIVLKEAATKVKNGIKKPCMYSLTEYLDEWDEKDDDYFGVAQKLARLIRVEKEVGMGQLIYGQGDEKTINLDNRLNIIQIQNLKMPEKDTQKEDYTSEEVMSSVIIMILSQFAKKFALKNKDKMEKIFQVILFDESWMLGKTKQGQNMYNFLVRMGRSMFTAPIFNGHSVTDISDVGVRNGITYRFCFRTNDDDEAERMLQYLGMEISPKNINLMKSLPNATCMFRDKDGRVGKLHFDVVFKELHDILSTTPKQKGAA